MKNNRFGASLVAQLVKNSPALWETWVPSLGWEDPLEKGKATHSGILAWRIPWITVHGVSKSRTWLSDFHFTSVHNCITMLCYFLLFSKWISYIHTYILSLLDLPLSPHPVSLHHHKVSWAPVRFRRFPLAICFMHSSAQTSVPTSRFIPHLFPSAKFTHLTSMSASLFLPCK